MSRRHRGRRRPPGRAHLRHARDPRASVARSRREHRHRDALHGAGGGARRAGQAHAAGPHDTESRRILDGEPRWAHLRVRRAQGRAVPQRPTAHGRGREVQLRALSRRRGQDAEGEGQGRDVGDTPADSLRAERAVARLPHLLRHARDRRRLDRAEEVRRAGRRCGIPQAPHRRGAVQVRQPPARRRARPRGPREVLAKDTADQAARHEGRAGRGHAPGHAQER
jgi:hypothetical protein